MKWITLGAALLTFGWLVAHLGFGRAELTRVEAMRRLLR